MSGTNTEEKPDKDKKASEKADQESDPEELTKEDFQQAGAEAKGVVASVTEAVQKSAAETLRSLEQAARLPPDAQMDPDLKQFREDVASAAEEVRTYVHPASNSDDKEKTSDDKASSEKGKTGDEKAERSGEQ